jgi:glycosyltransferase involved in cell wall biosynthesis
MTPDRVGPDPLVSVVVCNYNHGRFLEAAVESIAAQTHARIELFLIDDASSDESSGVMACMAARWGYRFTAIAIDHRERNSGKLACLNACLDRARGELVLEVDADDTLQPTFVEESIAVLRARRSRDRCVAFVYTDCELIDADGRALGIGRSLEWDRNLLDRSSYIPGCAVTLAAALRTALPFDESIRVGTKHHKWLRMKERGWAGHHVPRPLFSYRLHGTNISGIGARLLPELSRRRGSQQLLGQVWPTALAEAGGSA